MPVPAFAAPSVALAHSLSSGKCVVTTVSRAWRASCARTACESAAPSAGSVPDASSSTSTSDRSVAVRRIETTFAMCAENVERLIAIDC